MKTEIPLQPASLDIWDKKYRLKDNNNELVDVTINDTYKRVALALSSVEAPDKQAYWYDKFMWALQHGAIPAGRIIANAGALGYKPATSTINCLAGDTPVVTDRGVFPISQLVGKRVQVVNGCGDWSEVEFKQFGEQTTYPLKFRHSTGRKENSITIRATSEHRWILKNGKTITTEYWMTGESNTRHILLPHVRAPRPNSNSADYQQGLLHGIVFGDGHKISDAYYCLDLVGDKVSLAPLVENVLSKREHATVYNKEGSTGLRWNFSSDAKLKEIPDNASGSYILGFFAGILATDGSVTKSENCSTYMNVYGSKELLLYLERHLPVVGIKSQKLSLLSAKGTITNYGARNCDIWRLSINPNTVDMSDVLRAEHKNNFILTPHGISHSSVWTFDGVDTEASRIEPVYCCEEPVTHSFVIADGLLTGNCTVSDTIHDSMDSIFTKLHDASMTMKSGCGIGYNFSTLRPRGAFVAGAGSFTSGPLSFMDIYDKMCFAISSAGARRGAQMGTFDISHPDVKDFIRAKRENGRLRQFNLSLLVTDDFMKAVDNDADWPLVFPVNSKEEAGKEILWREWPVHEGYTVRDDGLVACKVYDVIKARHLWDMIMASTYDYAEPGFIMIDRCNDMNNNWWCENLRATNPSMPAGTLVHTRNGIFPIEALDGKSFQVRSADGQWARGTCLLSGHHVETMKISFGSYKTIESTPEHRWPVFDANTDSIVKKYTKDLRVGDYVPLNLNEELDIEGDMSLTEDDGFLLGVFTGDGWLSKRTNGDGYAFGISFNKADRSMADRCITILNKQKKHVSTISERPHELCIQITDLTFIKWFMTKFGIDPGKKVFPSIVWHSNNKFIRGFVDGYMSTDGCVTDRRVILTCDQEDLLVDFARLLSFHGIKTIINRHDTNNARSPNGKGYHKSYVSYHMKLAGIYHVKRFAALFSLTCDRKQKLLDKCNDIVIKRDRISNYYNQITSLGMTGEKKDVWDISVYHEQHIFPVAWGFTGNCGEQILPPNGSCLLGSINLTKFVRDAFGAKPSFDWDEFLQVAHIFTRMLDNVVEINGLPLEQQRDEITQKRRHGMGFLGLGSAITMLKMKYGDDDAIAFTEEVSRELAIAGWEVALELAKEKGAAPALLKEYPVTNEMLRKRPEMKADGYAAGDMVPGRILHAKYSRYMQRIASLRPELVNRLAEVGARFTHHTSVAPTGTIALSLANNASNGIEPSFAHSYSRNVIREGRKAKEKIDVLSYELLAYRALINENAKALNAESVNKLPDYFVTADNVTPKQHVDMQAAAQKWIDSSISKTANVPTNYPYDDFKDIYRYAYKMGLKGCTTFRYNPAVFQGVLVKEADLEKTTYKFVLDNGDEVELKGNDVVEYDGETHSAANLFDALKEGYYGKY